MMSSRPPTPSQLPLQWVALDAVGIALLALGLLVSKEVVSIPMLVGLGLPLCIVGGLLMGFATVLILRELLAQQSKQRNKP